MKPIGRRAFLQSSAILTAATVAGPAFDIKKKQKLLAFSTLGCPDWTFQQIIDFAVLHTYNGIEIRGIQRKMDLAKCPEFNTAENRAVTMRKMADKGLKFTDLGSSANMHFSPGAERDKNLAEGKSFIDLAHEINCPYIRVFPNRLPKEQSKETTMELIVKGLQELGDHAKGSHVTVLMETHGDLVHTADISRVMQSANHEQVGLVWDIANMWTVAKEPPAEVYKKLKKYIRHAHIKDAKIVNDTIEYKLLGQGEVPIFEGIDALAKDDYKGYYSFEWEKMWHPEILEPEVAIADYAKVMRSRK